MEQTQLSMTLRQSAINNGLCDEWKNAWKDNCTQQELINKYLRGIDFCLQHRWPSNRFITDNFDIVTLRRNNIIVDDSWSLNNPQEAVILGDSKATVRVNGRNSSEIYIRDTSEVAVHVHTGELVLIHVFDKTTVRVYPSEVYDINCTVICHSKDAVIEAPKVVKYKEELYYLK